MSYELIDHTADFGLHVKGNDANSLFVNAAHAMFDQITDTLVLKGIKTEHVRAKGDDWPDLMINWLRELLYLWTGKSLLVKVVMIDSLSKYQLLSTVKVDCFDPNHHVIKDEIKGVTYHQVLVRGGKEGWKSKIFFDV
jgi:SHS2 domain-containing protein|tara:strand:+ start:248 stop:661 length:414 start_codon:yes stop_codon:yes gene_type:complete